MNTAALINFPKPSFTKGVNVNIQKGEDGYTPLPNFICDEGYLAVLDGDAIKCLLFLNRHIKGFHLPSKGMSETLVKKITGIKDGRTVQKYMAQLATYQLVKINKERGKSNVYFLTFDDRLPTQHVGTFNAPTRNAPTPNVGGLPTQHVGGTTYTACGSVKETYLKENIKNKKKLLSVDNLDSDIFSNSIEYHCEDQNLYTFRELANVYTIKSDFTAQAKNLNSELTDDQILADLKNFAQWSTTREKTTAQGWMNYWIYRIQNLSTPKSKAESKPKSAPGTKKLSDSQRHMFANKLSVLPEMNKYSQGTESYQQFAVRIAQMLQDPNKFKELSGQLRSVGFVGSLEDFA